MSRSDSRPLPQTRLCFPVSRWGHLLAPAPPGLPGSSTDLSPRAVPLHPGEPNVCSRPLLPRRSQASPHLAGWPLSLRFHEADSGSLALRLAGSLPEASPAGSLQLTLRSLPAERAIRSSTSFQVARSARLGLAHQIAKKGQIRPKLLPRGHNLGGGGSGVNQTRCGSVVGQSDHDDPALRLEFQ
jgi:hypothetical protein